MVLEKHTFTFEGKPCEMWVRPGTKDTKVIKEVLEDRTYRQSRIKFDVRPDEVWYDLGAHIGCFSRYALLMGATVTAWEPDAENYEVLFRNLHDGIKSGRAKTIKGVVTGYKNRTMKLYGPSRKVDGVLPNTKFMVDGMPSYVAVGEVNNYNFNPSLLHGVTGIKMDIEGSEAGILDNLPKLPACVTKLVLEYHFIKDRNMARFRSRMDALRKQFPTVHYPKHLDRFIKEGLIDYPGYFDRLVFCKR